MDNTQYNSNDVKKICENKLNISFRSGKEFNGWYLFNDIKIARITVPKGRKYLPPGTYKAMANQLKLTTTQFDDLLACPLNSKDYKIIIKKKVKITKS